jgi:hypothetical protein
MVKIAYFVDRSIYSVACGRYALTNIREPRQTTRRTTISIQRFALLSLYANSLLILFKINICCSKCVTNSNTKSK